MQEYLQKPEEEQEYKQQQTIVTKCCQQTHKLKTTISRIYKPQNLMFVIHSTNKYFCQ